MSLPAEARQRIRHARDARARAKLADELGEFTLLTGPRGRKLSREEIAARRQEVAALRARGHSFEAIAHRFGLHPRTIKSDLRMVTRGDNGDVPGHSGTSLFNPQGRSGTRTGTS